MQYEKPEMEIMEFDRIVVTLASLEVDNGGIPEIPGDF